MWDMAAFIPIVREAGGTITALDGTDALSTGSAVSTNGALHAAVLAALNAGR
jgi:histidinol-phosphatase